MADKQVNIKVSADANGFNSAIDKAKDRLNAYGGSVDQQKARQKAFQQALDESGATTVKHVQQLQKAVAEMDRLASTTGKSRAQLAQMKADSLGASNAFSGYVKQMEDAAQHTEHLNLATASARREMLVLAHEASQGNWKQFGGSVLVLFERIDALSLILSPLGLAIGATAGAAALFFKTLHDGYAQVEAFNKAINSTGGFIGLSAAQMAEMSNGLQTTHTRLSEIREAMAQVAATGAFTGDTLALATQAAVAMSSDIGISTDKAAESLAKIQDDVLKWVAEYQKSHHTFNAAQIEEIDGFVKLGDTTSAVRAIMKDLANSHAAIEADADKHMGVVVDWWNQLKYSVARAKEAIASIGVPDSIDKQVGDQYAKVEAAERNLAQQRSMGMIGNLSSAQELLDKEKARLDVLRQQQGVVNTQQRLREAAAKSGDQKVAVDEYVRKNKYAGPTQKRDQDIQEENEAFQKATKDLDKNSKDYQTALKQHYAAIQEINDQYSKRTKGHGNSEAFHGLLTSMIAANQLIEAEEKRHLASLKAQREHGLIDGETYFQKLHDIQAQAVDDEIANAQKRVDIAKGKPESSAYQEAIKQLKDLTAQRTQIDQTLTENLRGMLVQRSTDITKFGDQYANSLRTQQSAQQQAFATMFLAPDAKARADAAYQLYAQFEQRKEQLREQYDSPTADQTAFRAKLAIAQTYYDASMAQLQQDQSRQMAVRQSYADQIRLSMVYLAGVTQTNAELAGSAFQAAFSDMNNALEEFVTTGKGSFSSFASSVLADLSKIALRAAESRIFQSILGGTSFFSDGGTVGHYATGGSISGPGTGTSDSIPAMLSDGEYVVRASQAKKYGSLLDAINYGKVGHFATGGPVTTVPGNGGGGASVTNHLHMSLSGNGGGLTQEDLVALAPAIQNLIDKRITQRWRGQGGLAYQMKYGQI